MDGDGGSIGPDLSNIGSVRGVAHLREALTDPGRVVAERFVIVELETRDGRGIRGVRVNEDSFTVQVRDDAGRFYSLDKADLVRFDKRFGETLMPSYGDELNESELDDLVAYLVSLRSDR